MSFARLGPAPLGLIDNAARQAIAIATTLTENHWPATTVTFEFNGTTVAVDHRDTVETVVRRYHEQRRLGV